MCFELSSPVTVHIEGLQFIGCRYPNPRCRFATLSPSGDCAGFRPDKVSSVSFCTVTCHRLPLLGSVRLSWRRSPLAMRASDSNGYHSRLALLGWFPLASLSLVAGRLAICWLDFPHLVLVARLGMLKNVGAVAVLLGALFISPCTLGIGQGCKVARKQSNFFLCSFIQWFCWMVAI